MSSPQPVIKDFLLCAKVYYPLKSNVRRVVADRPVAPFVACLTCVRVMPPAAWLLSRQAQARLPSDQDAARADLVPAQAFLRGNRQQGIRSAFPARPGGTQRIAPPAVASGALPRPASKKVEAEATGWAAD
jgi:hypothetical protein